MFIHRLALKHWQSHKHSSADFTSPVTVFFGLNGSGKTALARAIGVLLRASTAAVEGSRTMPARRLIRAGEDAAEIAGSIARRAGETPVEVVRRLTARGLTTRVNSKEVPNEAFDFFTPPGIADPDSVFRVLADVDGLFTMDGENQKALLLSLVEPSVPAELVKPLPMHRLTTTIGTLADVDKAYDEAYKARTAANARRNALREVLNPGTTERPNVNAIRTKIEELRGEERTLVGQAGESQGERRALEQERERVVADRDKAIIRLRELGQPAEAAARIKGIDAKLQEATKIQTARTQGVADISRLKGEADALARQRVALVKLGEGDTVACPFCARPLKPEDRKKQDATWAGRIDEFRAEIARREQALPKVPDTKVLDDQRAATVRIQQSITDMDGQKATADRRLGEIDARLAKLPRAAAPSGPSPELQQLRDRIARGENNLKGAEELIRQIDAYAEFITKAQAVDAEVAELEVLVKHLGPKGIAERLLAERIGDLQRKVNTVLGPFRLQVEYAQDPWEIRVNGVPARLMARSEAFRCGIAHQVALAAVTGARLCVIDGADLLDLPGRQALFAILGQATEAKILDQAIVFATYTSQPPASEVPWATHYLVEIAGDGSVVRRL